MIKKKICCDICGRQVDYYSSNYYRIKAKSNNFVTWVNYDDLFADRRTLDICKDCVEDCIEYIKNVRLFMREGEQKKNEQGGEA